MALTVGTKLGSHEITALLGKGGMGEVYRAKDSKLKREVAIKILPEEFSRDTDRVSRFQREAQVLASLNHPNIAAIYDLEEANETRFLVLELVEGETLAERIQHAPIPLEEALVIAKHICEALEAAHEKGVVHRDLKPGNVKITPEGKVKVLDFGLAKAMEATPAEAASKSPTLLSAAATNGGMILGTAGYMSPEQAKGHPVDQRSDIFSFGCVLYEMLTGRQAFRAETVTETIAAVLMREPDLAALPGGGSNSRSADLIRRCFAKNRKDRWHAIADVRLQLELIAIDPRGLNVSGGETRAGERLVFWRRVATALSLLIMASAITATVVWTLRPLQHSPIVRFLIVLPEGQGLRFANRHLLTLSPDGPNLVYSANQRLYLRSMSDMEAKPLQGTAGEKNDVTTPIFSPEGRWVAFYSFTDRRIKKVAIGGGAAIPLCEADNPYGGSWAANNQIIIGQGSKGIIRCSANGGKPETIVSVNSGEFAHQPQLLPGDDAVLFTLAPSGPGIDRWDKAKIVLHSLKSGVRKVLIENASDARYVPTGHIVYASGAALFAVPFDTKTLQVTGDAVQVLEGVMRSVNFSTGAAQFTFSNDGTLAYIPGDVAIGASVLVRVDRAGVRKPIDTTPDAYAFPRISSNGKQLVVSTSAGQERTVWVYDDLAGAAQRRKLTLDGKSTTPIWSKDDQRIVFRSDEEDGQSLYWQSADGRGTPERLVQLKQGGPSPDFFSDARTLIFGNGIAGSRRNLYSLSVGAAGQEPRLLLQNATSATVSRDGNWLAYTSSTSGRSEVYVQAFPITGAATKYQVTTDGADSPLWSPDGTELFYLSLGERRIYSVLVHTKTAFTHDKPTPLPIQGILAPGPRNYDITPDGKYFVTVFPGSQANGGDKAPFERINITLNWFEELKQRVPVH